MDKLVEKLDDEATQDFDISTTSHSKMTEFRRQLKLNAIQAAKNKGAYLTESIGEKLGEAIIIKEPDENFAARSEPYSQVRVRGANSLSSNLNMRLSSGDTYSSAEINFKKMKLRFEVEVVFALK